MVEKLLAMEYSKCVYIDFGDYKSGGEKWH